MLTLECVLPYLANLATLWLKVEDVVVTLVDPHNRYGQAKDGRIDLSCLKVRCVLKAVVSTFCRKVNVYATDDGCDDSLDDHTETILNVCLD